ncbi:MAG: glycosyltransferase [Sphaerochaetaceae bacterium]|nr:glycosyltransferase [Sphaerochaetaceae bacterium]
MSSKRKVKILYIVESFATGVYAIVRDIACNLTPGIFDIHIIHSLREDSPATYEEDFDRDNITLQYIPMGSLNEYPKAVKSIRDYVRSYMPDAIHLHSSKAGVLGRLALARNNKTPLFYSPHGFSFLREDVNAFKRRTFFSLERLIQAWHPAVIIAVSDGEAEHAQRITSKVTTISNFIDTSLFESEEPQDGGLIVTCGRVSPQKNPGLFNEIARSLPDEHFMWVGDGPLREKLTSENITVTGLLPRSEAIQKVKEAKLYIQTSLWEGMPVSILEAMAAGKAVIASDIVGNRDLIRDGVTGYLCDAHASEEFIREIRNLMTSPRKKQELGKAACEYVREHHSLKSAVLRYEDLYLKRGGR